MMLVISVQPMPEKVKAIASKYDITLLSEKITLTNMAIHAEWRLFEKINKLDYGLLKTGSDYQLTCYTENWSCLFTLNGADIYIDSAIKNKHQIKAKHRLKAFETILTEINAIQHLSLID